MHLDCLSSRLRFVATLLLAISAIFSGSALPGAAKAAPTRATAALQQRSGGEYVQTFAADCITPQTVFNLGDTVCAEAGGFPLAPSFRYRRFEWIAPDRYVADQTNIKVDPQNDSFIIPTSGQFAQPGTWTLASINADSDLYAVAKFIVRDPRIAYANLSINKLGQDWVYAGDTVSYRIRVTNPGPDFAESVQIVDTVPANMTFLALKQASGPLVDCSTPLRGETGRSVCNVKGLSNDEAVELVAYYQVIPDAREGSVCTSSVQVSSFTNELDKYDNVADTESTVIVDPIDTGSPPDGE